MWRILTLSLLLTMASCANLDINPDWVVDGPVRGDEAIALIKARLGGTEWLPVYWYGPKALESCPWDDLYFQGPEGCVSSITGDNASIIGWDGILEPSWTGLTHELAHQRYDDGDHENTRIWGKLRGFDDYEPGSIVGDINIELIAAGM